LALAAALLPLTAAAQVRIGDAFPALASAHLEGSLPATAGKVVLVDFWASWCAPCKASFPAYARLGADLGPRGLVIVAIGEDTDQGAYQTFLKRLRPPFAVALDRDQILVGRVQIPTMPTSYLIDRQGRMRYLHPGFHGADTEAALRREIETLLAEPAS
jgi:thiol-disulfide isomerase/thioredoxin